MATIVTRSGKGSPLTNNEVDANFTNLNTDKLEVGGGTLTGALTISSGGLTVNSGTVNLNTTFQSTDDIVQINFTDDDTTNSITSSGVGFRFLSAGSEKARLTNSANLLIGESGGSISNSSSATGINLKPNSSSAFSRNGGTTLFLNRLNTDGDILVFRNSGSTVGSIASRSGAVTTMIFDPRANGSGISGTTNGIIPTNQSGTPTNNHVDLGSTTNKFKDLHLSGTVNAESGTFGSLTVDDISINGSTISDSGNLTLDVGGDISLDADGGNIKLSDGGTEVGRFLLNDSNHLKLKSIQSNADIKFQGNDDGTGITALTLDMSDAGTAIFNHDIKLGDNSKAIFGAGNDLQIYHDGANSYVSDQGVGALRILTNGLQVKNAADTENIIVGNQNGAVTLYHNGSPKLATTSTGISISNDANFPDNGKAIFGASDDLQIYHDGSNSYISEVGAGSLKIQSTSGLALQDSSGNNFAVFTDEGTGGKVELYKSSTVRLTTTTSGIDVTGRIQTTAAAGNHTVFNSTGADADFRVRTGADTHSFYVEGNTGNIGLGTSSPNGNGSRTTLHINSDTNGSAIRLSQSSNSSLIRYSDSAGLEIGTIASKTLKLETNDTTALTIDTSQNSTFAGTISSGAITSTGLTVNAAQSNFNDSAGAVIAFQKSSSAKAWIANRSYGFHDGNGLAINTTDANPIRFGTNNSEVARLTSSGHLGIGTTTVGTLHGASYGTTQLHIDGKTDRGQMIIEGDTLSLIAMSDNSATANSRVFLSMVNDGLMEFRSVNDDGTSKATIMSMTSAGATTFSDNVSLLDDKLLMFGTGSDARLKFDSSTNALMITATNGTADNIRTQSNNLSLEQANGGKYISATANDSVKLYHADTPVVKTTAGGLVVESGMNFNMTGSMMIGATTAPDTALHVKTSADTIIKVEKTDGNYIQLHGTGAGGRIKSDGQINFDVGSNSGALNLASNGNATFLGSVTSTGLTASTQFNSEQVLDQYLIILDQGLVVRLYYSL